MVGKKKLEKSSKKKLSEPEAGGVGTEAETERSLRYRNLQGVEEHSVDQWNRTEDPERN